MDATLVEENRLLTEELTKCKADKEFVWSLWKQLQSESPDLTAAVDTAISREKKKYEAQIEKVVHIVQKKDREIASLKQIIRCQDEKLLEAEVVESKMQADTNQRNGIVKELEERLSALTVIVSEAEQQRITNVERQQSWTAEVMKLKERLVQLEKEKGMTEKICEDQENELKLQRNSQEELHQNLSKLSTECTEHMKMCSEVKQELELKEKQAEALKLSVDHRDKQISDLSEQLHRVKQEFMNTESQLSIVQSALEGKSKEVSTSHQQLLLAQQQLIITQQKCSQLEEYAESYTAQLQVAREEIEKLRVAVVEREQQIAHLSKLSESIQSTCQERTNSLQSVVRELTALHEVLTKERAEHDLVVKGLKQELLTTNNRMLRELELTQQQLSPSTESTVSPTGLHVAAAPSQESARLTELLVMTEKELFNTKSLLEAKDSEVMATRKAHSQRLARMKTLQIDYKLVVEQLKTYETEKSPQLKARNIGRSATLSKGKSPQSGEALWSQLTNYKRQVETLSKKLTQAEEEKDKVQVKLAREQTATAKLQAILEAEKDELTQKLNSLATKTADVTVEEKKKTKEIEETVKALQEEKTNTLSAHKILEEKYYELQEEMARTKSALLLAEKRMKESTASPVPTVERCNSIVQTDCHHLSPSSRHKQFDATRKGTTARYMYPYKRYHSRSLSDTFLQSYDFQENESSILSELSSSSSSSSLTVTAGKPVVLEQRKGADVSIANGISRNATELGNSMPVTMVDTAVQCSCEEQQSLAAKRNLMHQQIISKFQRESKSLKHRLATLSKQVEVLNSSKQSLTRALQQEKEQSEMLKTETVSQNDKLQQYKTKLQSLNDDVSRLTEENNTLKQRYELLENIKVKAASSVADKSVSGHSEAEWKSLEQRMKSLLEKYSAQNSCIQELQKQLHDKTMDLNQAQERLQHCERDVRQKRTFIENLRGRLRAEKFCQAEWEDAKVKLKEEISVLTERSVQCKQQIERLKKQLNREQHEKEHLCVMNAKCAEELELTLQRLDHCRTELKRRDMTCNAETNKLHKTSQELQELHAAHQLQMTNISSQLKQKDLRINELHNFTKELAVEIAALVNSKVDQNQATDDSDDEALASRARKIAFSTLNLSASEFEQFVTESETEKKQSSDKKKLVQQINATLDSKPPFSTKLVKLFMRIIENDRM